LSRAFRAHGLLTALILFAACCGLVIGVSSMFGRLAAVDRAADFYQVMPHETMVSLFGAVALFVVLAIAVARARFAGDISPAEPGAASPPTATRSDSSSTLRAYRDAFTLRHLHATGADCATALETRRPWRRWFHHLTLGGFLLCAASTSVAAVYHLAFGWRAPYALDSLPVLLGVAGGLGLLVGPAGSFAIRFRRDEELSDLAQSGLDVSFIALLWVTSATGLVLLILRGHAIMPALLMVHLASVLALFLTLPFGKFIHGVYRIVALMKYASDEARDVGTRLDLN
jgi:citrate/tricarballylate utilization protein